MKIKSIPVLSDKNEVVGFYTPQLGDGQYMVLWPNTPKEMVVPIRVIGRDKHIDASLLDKNKLCLFSNNQ